MNRTAESIKDYRKWLDLVLPATPGFHNQYFWTEWHHLSCSGSVCTSFVLLENGIGQPHWLLRISIQIVISLHVITSLSEQIQWYSLVSPSKVLCGTDQLASSYISNSWCSHVIVSPPHSL